ncbi:hypothetical protein [Moorena sp. SIO4G3]|uniref:hypothetical protein n=1 Tax=Moorena sp. SIO4G3 TaxID=2607821 RepID=UPI00142BB29F|nr:hypothetical protein [Moorena sp. SIO4G3]NEO76521.1 hypothetical protein [Moorena sp. SIO4G3]
MGSALSDFQLLLSLEKALPTLQVDLAVVGSALSDFQLLLSLEKALPTLQVDLAVVGSALSDFSLLLSLEKPLPTLDQISICNVLQLWPKWRDRLSRLSHFLDRSGISNT